MIFLIFQNFALLWLHGHFFRLQRILLVTKNVICPVPSAPQVFLISIRTVLCAPWPSVTILLLVIPSVSLVRLTGLHRRGFRSTKVDALFRRHEEKRLHILFLATSRWRHRSIEADGTSRRHSRSRLWKLCRDHDEGEQQSSCCLSWYLPPTQISEQNISRDNQSRCVGYFAYNGIISAQRIFFIGRIENYQ